MSTLRDLPPVSGQIVWARQIERQLNSYLQRVGHVLGAGWHFQVGARCVLWNFIVSDDAGDLFDEISFHGDVGAKARDLDLPFAWCGVRDFQAQALERVTHDRRFDLTTKQPGNPACAQPHTWQRG